VRSIWRRNLQFRLVAITVVLSAIVLGVVGAALLNRVSTGLLHAKEQSSLTEASAAREEVQRLLNASDTGSDNANTTRIVDSVITALAVRSGSPGLFDALLLANPSLIGQPERGTKLISQTSVPLELRKAVQDQQRQMWQYTTIKYEGGATAQGIVVGAPVTMPHVGEYELYLLFPMSNESDTINLIQGAVLVTGIALLVGLGIMAWFITGRVTEPVRQAAQVAEELASGELDRRLSVRGEDDLATLAASFNAMAESLQQQIQRLEALSHIQQRFVSDVSHELRTPLTTVRMASEMLYDARDVMDPEIARSAELLRNQVDRFDLMLSDLLEISRFDAGETQLEVAPVDMRALISGIRDEFQDIVERHDTKLEVSMPNLNVVVDGDSRRISRIVRNLIANAIEHSESKPVEVTLAMNNSAVSVGVRDYGHGIAPENLENVFGRFWRADPSRQRTLGGSGLGLAISQDDAQLHGGQIDVWSAPGKGAHFVLTLPRAPREHFDFVPIEVNHD
jgi:two-component system sensor histidine kinase MtrB